MAVQTFDKVRFSRVRSEPLGVNKYLQINPTAGRTEPQRAPSFEGSIGF
jgi:hypothetical protein